MKQQFNKNRFLLLIGFLVGTLLYYGCSKEEYLGENAESSQSSFFGIKSDNTLLELSYEIETFTKIRALQDTEDTYDKITMMPSVDRQKVKMSITQEGDVSWEMEKMTPQMELKLPNYNLPNNQAVPYRTIVENGEMVIYDKKGNELYKTSVETPKLEKLSKIVKQTRDEHTTEVVNQAVSGLHSNLYVDGLESIVSSASQLGVSVNHLNEDVMSIRMPSSLIEVDGFSGEVVHLIDRGKNLLLATRLYDDQDELISSMMIRYEEINGANIIRGIRQETPDILPSGTDAIMEVSSSIENLNFTINS